MIAPLLINNLEIPIQPRNHDFPGLHLFQKFNHSAKIQQWQLYVSTAAQSYLLVALRPSAFGLCNVLEA